MSDKDLLVVISEMLRKQDQQAEKLDEHSATLGNHTEILNHHSEILHRHTEILNKQSEILNKQSEVVVETNNTLKQFMELSLQEFQGLHSFNEQQNQFNERFLNKLDDIEKALKK